MSNEDNKFLCIERSNHFEHSLSRIDTNNELIISPNGKNTIESALAYAIANGAKVDCEQSKDTSVSPQIICQINHHGFSAGISLNISRKTTRKYRMKD